MIKRFFNRLIEQFSAWYQALSGRIFVKIIVIVIIPHLLLVGIIQLLTTQSIRNKIEEMNQTLFVLEHATNREIKALFNNVTILTNQILIEQDVQTILSSRLTGSMETNDVVKHYSEQETLRNLLSIYRLVWNNLYSIAIIDLHGQIFLNTSENYQLYSEDLRNSRLFQTLQSKDQKGLSWSVQDRLIKDKDMIAFGRKIYGVRSPEKVIGYVLINMKLDAIRNSFETYNYYGPMIFGLYNEAEGQWMLYENGRISGEAGPIAALLEENSFRSRGSRELSIPWNETTWRVVSHPLEGKSYLFVGLDEAFIQHQAKQMRTKLYLGYLFVLIIALLISSMGTRSFLRRIGKLIHAIRLFGNEQWGTRIHLKGKDEISLIGERFNWMAAQIENLLNDLQHHQRLKRMFELRVLEYQINPHFLYNTLDSIHWLALEKNQHQISEMVNGLSRLFRLILSKGKEKITLQEEFEMVDVYLRIQKIRFADRFHYTMTLNEEVACFSIAKLVLQPIVENAIIHGIRKLRRPGTIQVIGRYEDERIILEVIDDGVGFTSEQLEKQRQLLMTDVLQEDSIESTTGYGLKNVDSRLKLMYGPRYEMQLDSREGYTCVRIIIQLEEQ